MSKKYLVTQDQTVDGMPLEGSSVIHYTTCSTAAATAAKTAALSGFKLVTGALAAVRFTVTNTAANPTLNINSTGAKAVRYRNAAVNAGVLATNRTYFMVYDGTYWQIIGDLDTNTTYSAATASAAGLMSAADKKKLNALPNTAIDIVTGTKSDTTGTPSGIPTVIPYKTGRTKALVMLWRFETIYSPSIGYGCVLLTDLSSSMSTITETLSMGTVSATVRATSSGNIEITGYGSRYCIIWFN